MGERDGGVRFYEGDTKTSGQFGTDERLYLPDNSYSVRDTASTGPGSQTKQILDGSSDNSFEIVDPTKWKEPAVQRGNPYNENINDLTKDFSYYRKGLITRGYESVFGENQNPRQRYGAAIDALYDDQDTRSAKSMNNAIDRFVHLGMARENIGVHALMMHERSAAWDQRNLNSPLQRPGDKLKDHRAMIILSLATAETNLQHGTMVPRDNQPAPGLLSSVQTALFDNDTSSVIPKETVTYILADKQLDLGGLSLTRTLFAKKSIELAKTETTRNMGTRVDRSVVTPSEITDLDAMNTRVNALHDKIQGKHDIAGALTELTKYIDADERNIKTVMKTSDYIDKQIMLQAREEQTSDRSEYIAKLLRDKALINMAVASSSNHSPDVLNSLLLGDPKSPSVSIGGQKYNLTGAQDCLKWSNALDSGNPQLGDLTTEFEKLKKKIQLEKQ